ncbi:phage minor head protein [Rhizobium sp. YJ-22]|uniref:phage head morphogenesis protein n=1 Tax=Rhizobium sp. YJ-22 TaxID=3037556 RepID=UPI00241217E9|nr:phage minor head protein [Rhizobium sp. YJ-22]MDG3580406.1 phage minor head protein [Rhizobium sp. YJ-22]
MAQLTERFATPPEVTGYFDRKTLKPAFSWLDVFADEHAYAFTVAKATEVELLTSFRNTISSAIANGQGFDNWKKDISAELQRLGWYGPRMVKDPTGVDPDRMVNFASDRRLKTIFWSNANSARAAGQWERAQRSKRGLPYFLYIRTTSADPRPEHLAWVGIILPVDHLFWKTHFPPNGWLCKCQVRQISAREAARLLGTSRVIGKDDDGNDITIRYSDQVPDLGPDLDFKNRRTGEIIKVPPGIDPGWHTNPGLARASTLIQNFEEKLAVAHQDDATKVLKDLWDDPYLRIAPRLPEKVWLPAGHSPALAEELGAVSPVISITSEAIAERLGKHKMAVEDFSLLPDILSSAESMPDLKGKANTRSLLWRAGRVIWRTFVSVSQNGYMRANSLHQKDEKEARKQVERAGFKWPWD